MLCSLHVNLLKVYRGCRAIPIALMIHYAIDVQGLKPQEYLLHQGWSQVQAPTLIKVQLIL